MKRSGEARKKPRLLPRVTCVLLGCSLGLWLMSMAGATYFLAMTARNMAVHNAEASAEQWLSHSRTSAEKQLWPDLNRAKENGTYLYWLYQDCLPGHLTLADTTTEGSAEGSPWYLQEDWLRMEQETFSGVYDREGKPILVEEPGLLLHCVDEGGAICYLYARANEPLEEQLALLDEELRLRQSCQTSGWLEEDGSLALLALWGRPSTEEDGEEPVRFYLREGISGDYEESGETLEDYVPAGKQLVTLQLEDVTYHRYAATSPVTTPNGETYDDLGAVLEETMASLIGDIDSPVLQTDTLLDLVIVCWGTVSLTENGSQQVRVAYAARCSPLLSAMNWLKTLYLITFLLSLLWPLALRGMLKRHVVRPLEQIPAQIKQGMHPLPTWPNADYRFREIEALVDSYNDAAEGRRMLQNETIRLNRAVEYAKTAEEQRRMMTSGLAHELKTPLAIVHSYAEGLQEHIAEEKREEYLNVILSESERMDGIIQDMLALSRLESGRAKLERTEVSLGELAERCFQPMQRAMEEKQLTFASEVNSDVIVNADETRLGQVITNFASNAVRYTPEGGTITLRVGYALGGAQCSVENTCPPIPEEILSRVWEPFFRGTKSRTERSSGLGLTIAKSIVELHGGKVQAERTKDGVKFSFTL